MIYHGVCSLSQNSFILKQGEPIRHLLYSNSKDFSTQDDIPVHPQVFYQYFPPEKQRPQDLWVSAAGFWSLVRSSMPGGTQFYTRGSWDERPATEETWPGLQHHTRTSYFKNKCRKIKDSHMTRGFPFLISSVSPQSRWHPFLSSDPHLYLVIFKVLIQTLVLNFVCFSSFK